MDIVFALSLLIFVCLSVTKALDIINDAYNEFVDDGREYDIFEIGLDEDTNTAVYGDVKFYLYNRDTNTTPEVYTINGSSNDPSIFKHFSMKSETKIIIHGWHDDVNSRLNVLLRNAYLAHCDYNVIVVDWSAAGSKARPYWRARKQVASVAGQVATFIDRLCGRFRLRPERLHLIGHSLGAHIAGLVYHNLTNGNIGRVTGLDPAGPGFNALKPEERINQDSGLFVDVIHTCGGYLAASYKIGHADFFPNSGKWIQPGCWIDVKGSCSHKRAFRYFAESIKNIKGFISTPCLDWNLYKKGECRDDGPNVVMGEFTPKSANGSYYLRTNKKPPFSKAETSPMLTKRFSDVN